VNISDKEMQLLFNKIDKDGKNSISYEHFFEVMNEDHLNFEKIKAKIEQELKNKSISLRALFNKFAGSNDYLSYSDVERLMKSIGFVFDSD